MNGAEKGETIFLFCGRLVPCGGSPRTLFFLCCWGFPFFCFFLFCRRASTRCAIPVYLPPFPHPDNAEGKRMGLRPCSGALVWLLKKTCTKRKTLVFPQTRSLHTVFQASLQSESTNEDVCSPPRGKKVSLFLFLRGVLTDHIYPPLAHPFTSSDFLL